MTLPDRFPPIFPETEDTVRARLLSAVPEDMSIVEGSFARDFLDITVGELALVWSAINTTISQMFIAWATGITLDAHGEQYGVPRSEGTAATGTVRFSGTAGETVIPPATLISVPTVDPDAERAVYQTTNVATVVVGAAGYVDVGAQAINPGADGNQPAGSVTYLDSPNVEGITAVTNLAPMTGGSDPDDDEVYRAKLLEAAKLPLGSGTLEDYVLWSLERPGIADATSQELWDLSGTTPGVRDGRENGSVLVSVRGPALVAVDWSELQDVQKWIDPYRQLVAIMEEGEPWVLASGAATVGWSATNKQMGEKGLTISEPAAGTSVVYLSRSMDLSRFFTDDDFYLWVLADDWSRISNTSKVRLYMTDTDYFEAAMSVVTPSQPTKPTSSSSWWLWRVQKQLFTATGNPSWSAINKIEITQVVTTGAAVGTYDYWSIRHLSGALRKGRAPVGQAATIVTPVPKAINVNAQVTLDPSATLTGAPGTANATELITASIVAFFQSLKPGEPMRTAKLAQAIIDTPGVVDVVLVTPGAVTTLNGVHVLPTSPLLLKSSTNFLPQGTVVVGNQKVAYTGISGNTLTGVTGGAGTIADGSPVRQREVLVSMNQYPVLGTLTLAEGA
jgi:uncharacterized phage protein gp47/JayE